MSLEAAKYSTLDDIIVLDSDDEDFPRSQLNATNIDDVPDFSSIFRSIYDEDDLIDEKPSVNFNCSQDTWFESLSQSNFNSSSKKVVIDLPLVTQVELPESKDEIPLPFPKVKKNNRKASSSLSKKENFCEQIRVQGLSQDRSARSPKRRISVDESDNFVKPPKKKKLIC